MVLLLALIVRFGDLKMCMLRVLHLWCGTLIFLGGLPMGERTCCFIGHRKIEITDELISRLTCEVEHLILSGVTNFIFGTRSEFNSICHKVVSALKEAHPEIVRIAYTAFHECVSLDVELDQYDDTIQSIWEHKVHLNGYDAEVTPEVLRKGGKATYVERNQIMIDLSDYCIFYYDENYRPERRERSRKYFNHNLTSAQSGTELAYRYALRKKKTIINVFN